MDGYILLSDGMRLEGRLAGEPKVARGWVVANTAVVGFQEMATDPAYKGLLLAFTYPEIGNVGAAAASGESPRVQAAGLVVKVLSVRRSHYLAEEDFEALLLRDGIPCLTDVDTRGLAVHLREHGEMAAAVAPADEDADALRESLQALERPRFLPTEPSANPDAPDGPKVAVLDLGLRRSEAAQLALCCRPVLLPHGADAAAVEAEGASGVIVSDGPGGGLPAEETVYAVASFVGKVPVLAWGLGHVALGMALGCEPTFLKRGHHGVNYPARCLAGGNPEVTCQRHTVMLDRGSVCAGEGTELLWENINDGTVEGIRSADGTATGLQFMPAAQPAEVSAHLRRFIEAIS
jgi:carbamoyl-phosphate synthase small subunit